MEMKIVDYFYNLSSDFLDAVFNIFSFLGTDLFFVILFFLMYWVGNKYSAFKFAGVYYLSVFLNFGLKNIIGRKRPYPKDVDSYAMPSGHAQSYSVAVSYNYIEDRRTLNYKTWQKIVFPILLGLVGVGVCISRMYFGRHYLSDVLVGLALGVLCAVLFDLLITKLASISKISLKQFLTIMLVPVIALYFVVAFTEIFSQETTIQIYTSVGLYIGVYIGYLLDDKFIKYKATGTPIMKVKKMLLGALIMIATYFVLVQTIRYIFLMPLIFIVLGFVGSFVVPVAIEKVFMPSIKVEE